MVARRLYDSQGDEVSETKHCACTVRAPARRARGMKSARHQPLSRNVCTNMLINTSMLTPDLESGILSVNTAGPHAGTLDGAHQPQNAISSPWAPCARKCSYTSSYIILKRNLVELGTRSWLILQTESRARIARRNYLSIDSSLIRPGKARA